MNKIAFFCLFLLAGCQVQDSGAPAKYKTIMIKADGKVETLPDMATFRIRLDCMKKSTGEAKQCLVEKSQELNRKLLSFGIKQQDILTTSVEMNPVYNWVKNSRVFEGYSSSTTMIVTVKNLDKLDGLYTELIENRNLEIGGLAYSHSQLDSLKNEAYANALKKAGVLADKLLTELPEKKKEILKIGNVAIQASIPEARETKQESVFGFAEAQSASVASNSVSISKGTVTVEAELFVEFQIK